MQVSYEERPANPARIAALRDFGVGTLLDVGCGNGIYVENASAFAVGIDIHGSIGWRCGNGQYVMGDASHLPFRARSFDTVSCFETLEHVDDPVAVASECARVARTRCILTVPNCELTLGLERSNLIYRHWIDPTHHNFFDASSLRSCLEDAGLRVTSITTINSIDIVPFVLEAVRVPQSLQRVFGLGLRKLARDYRMTLLAICDAR